VVLKSSKIPAAVAENVVGMEPRLSARATEEPTGPPLISHGSTGVESTASGLIASTGKSASVGFAGSSVFDGLSESMAAWYARTPDEQAVRFELRLDPPELGRVTIRLEKSRGKVTARLLVTNEAARVTVERDLPSLQQSLEDAGVNLDEFDLSKHSGRHSNDRSDYDRASMGHWAKRREIDMSQSAPVQADGTATGHVDLRA
jgi:flagellar hook-length control protein FliK